MGLFNRPAVVISAIALMGVGVFAGSASADPPNVASPLVDGLLVDLNSPEQVAAAVHRLVTEPATRRRLIEAARKTVEARFTIQRMVNSYEHLYDQSVRATRVVRAKEEALREA